MFGDLDKYLAVFLTGFFVTYFLTPLARTVARRWGIVDIPDERRPHQQPTPRGGGIAVVIGAHAACLVALALPWARYARSLDLVWWEHFVGASLVLLIVGVTDDICGVRPWLKLIGQAAAATLIFESGTKISSVAGVELPGALSYALTVLWLIAIINAFNLIDGLDGLACGLAIISALGLSGVLVLMRSPGDALVLLGLAGSCLAFLRFNFHPASVFLGDTGSMFLGFMLGTVSLQTLSQSTFMLAFATPLFVLGVPIFDTLLAVWRRSARRWLFGRAANGVSPATGIMRADVEHLHHRLLKAGLNARRVATLLWIANGLLVAFGLLITSFQSHAIGIFLIALMGALYVTLRHVGRHRTGRHRPGRAEGLAPTKPDGAEGDGVSGLGRGVHCSRVGRQRSTAAGRARSGLGNMAPGPAHLDCSDLHDACPVPHVPNRLVTRTGARCAHAWAVSLGRRGDQFDD